MLVWAYLQQVNALGRKATENQSINHNLQEVESVYSPLSRNIASTRRRQLYQYWYRLDRYITLVVVRWGGIILHPLNYMSPLPLVFRTRRLNMSVPCMRRWKPSPMSQQCCRIKSSPCSMSVGSEHGCKIGNGVKNFVYLDLSLQCSSFDLETGTVWVYDI